MTTLRTVIAASKSWLTYQVDSQNTFLYGDLREVTYVFILLKLK